MNYKDCIIVTNDNEGVMLRATRMTVDNGENFLWIYDGENLMGAFNTEQIKAAILMSIDDPHMVNMLMDVLTGRKGKIK